MKGFKFTELTDNNESNVSKLNKPVYLFGKDVRKIVCFRDSLICGICCGFGGGLASFLATSKVMLSTHIAFASLWIGIFGYWFPCRYRYENLYLVSNKLQLKNDFGKISQLSKNQD